MTTSVADGKFSMSTTRRATSRAKKSSPWSGTDEKSGTVSIAVLALRVIQLTFSFAAFQTAVALAIFDAKRDKKEPPEMTEKHLNQVVQMSSAFRKYMTAAHSGMDDSTWAFKHGNREDKFPSTPAKTDS